MFHSVKFNSILGLAVMLSLLVFAPPPSFASCKNFGGSSGSNKFGSQVNGGSVTICASAVSVIPARSATLKVLAKPMPKVAAKPAAKPSATRSAPAKLGFHKLAAPLAKPKLPTKPQPAKAKSKVISKPSAANLTSAKADFTPAPSQTSVYPSNQLLIGQQAKFVSSAAQHFRTGILLNLPTEVRFTPVSVAWDFGDGNLFSGTTVGHSFGSPGPRTVTAQVTYSISYRVRGSSKWIAEPDTITLANQLSVVVASNSNSNFIANDPTAARGKTLLVGTDCLEIPTAFGCN